MATIDVTDPAIKAQMMRMFQSPIADDGDLADHNAALNNLRAEIFHLRTALEAARYDLVHRDYTITELRDTITELTQDNELLMDALATARRMSQP